MEEVVQSGESEEWDLEIDMEKSYWSVKVIKNHRETEVKGDAQTGKVVETEYDD